MYPLMYGFRGLPPFVSEGGCAASTRRRMATIGGVLAVRHVGIMTGMLAFFDKNVLRISIL